MLIFPVALILLLSRSAAEMSFPEFQRKLSDINTLNELCALVIIQEFSGIILGFSILAEDREKVSGKWYRTAAYLLKFTAFLPSVLLIYAIGYWLMFWYNNLVEYPFDTLKWFSVLIVPAAAAVIMESMRLIFREHIRRITAVMYLEYLLVILAIFLPVASGAKLIESGENFDLRASLQLFSAFTAVVSVFTACFYIIKKYRKGKFHVNSNSNS